jgi:hypothetical protein
MSQRNRCEGDVDAVGEHPPVTPSPRLLLLLDRRAWGAARRSGSEHEGQGDDQAEAVGDHQQAKAAVQAADEENPGQHLAGDDADVARATDAAEPLLELVRAGDAGDERRVRRPEGAHVRAQQETRRRRSPNVRPDRRERQPAAPSTLAAATTRADPTRSTAVPARGPSCDPGSGGTDNTSPALARERCATLSA